MYRLISRPYEAYASRVGEDRIQALALERARRLLENDQTIAVAESDGIVAGAVLPWDSRHFGFTAARIDLLARPVESLLTTFLARCGERGIRHLTVRVGAGELEAIHALEHHGFELLDGIQTFSREPQDCESTTRLSRPDDEDQLAAIARTAFVYDRFHADSLLTGSQADALHEDWVRNSCRGVAADAVVVAESAGKIEGFATCKIDRETAGALGLSFGSIVLVATSPASRGKGVAMRTTRGCLAWFHEQGVDVVEVGTQIRNVEAGRLYQRAGFKLMNVSLTFRKGFAQTTGL